MQGKIDYKRQQNACHPAKLSKINTQKYKQKTGQSAKDWCAIFQQKCIKKGV